MAAVFLTIVTLLQSLSTGAQITSETSTLGMEGSPTIVSYPAHGSEYLSTSGVIMECVMKMYITVLHV